MCFSTMSLIKNCSDQTRDIVNNSTPPTPALHLNMSLKYTCVTFFSQVSLYTNQLNNTLAMLHYRYQNMK